MIFRKPYGFLIKHFKLIHFIMTLFMAFLVYQTNLLLEFFNDFVGSSQGFVGAFTLDSLFNNYSYFFAGIIVIAATVILILMSFKDKPRFYYILTIVGYILLIILYAYSVSTIGIMQESLVDERITRLIRDFLNIIFIFQIYSLFVSFIRSIGLDLKKFDFHEDFQELNITDKDSEEFEVNVEFDTHVLKRKIRRGYRNIKYYYIENKAMLLLVSFVIVLVIGMFVLRGVFNKEAIYKVGQVFSPINYNISITESYLTNNDYRVNNITGENKSLVVVKFKIKTPNKTSKFVFGKLALQIGDNKYYHINNYSSKLIDIGTTYINQTLKDYYQEYLLVYEIPTEQKNDSMVLVYTEQVVEGMFGNTKDDIKIKINPINLDEAHIEENISINQNYIIGTGLLKGYELKVNSFDVNDSFNINYNVCVKTNECYRFYEIVKPPLTGISDKAVLKLSFDLVSPDDANFNIKTLITQFGNIEYEVNGVLKAFPINKMINTTHNDGNYYFEIRKELLDADKINLVIKARNDVYRFKLK